MALIFGISVLFVVLALLLLAGCVRQMRRGRVVRAGGNLTGGVATASLGATGMMLGISYLGYERLTAETVVGELEFVALGEDYYSVRLMRDEEGLHWRWGIIFGALYGLALLSKFNLEK